MGAVSSVIVRLDGTRSDVYLPFPSSCIPIIDNDGSMSAPIEDSSRTLFSILGFLPPNDADVQIMFRDSLESKPVFVSFPIHTTFREFSKLMMAVIPQGELAYWIPPNGGDGTMTVITFYDFGGIGGVGGQQVTTDAQDRGVNLALAVAVPLALAGSLAVSYTAIKLGSRRSQSALFAVMSIAFYLAMALVAVVASSTTATAAVIGTPPSISINDMVARCKAANDVIYTVRGMKKVAQQTMSGDRDKDSDLDIISKHGVGVARAGMLRHESLSLGAFAHAFARGEITAVPFSTATAFSPMSRDTNTTVHSVTVYSDARFTVSLGWIPPHTTVPTHAHALDVFIVPASPGLGLTLLAGADSPLLFMDSGSVVDAAIGVPYLVPRGRQHSASAGDGGAHFFAIHAKTPASILDDII